MPEMLEIRGIRASYGGREVLHGIDLTVRRGRVTGLVGESGSGKSTAAALIAGIKDPDSGEILWEGKTLDKKRSREMRRKIQMVFQDPEGSLNPVRPVGKAVTEAMVFHGSTKDEAESRMRELFGRLRLPEDTPQRLPRSFSGGQKQRIALTRALGVRPELLIADEPTSALDVSVQLSVLEQLRELKETEGLTMLFITHDLGVVRYLCDDIILIKEGRVMEAGPADRFFEGPRTDYGRQLLDAVPGWEDRWEI